MIRDSTRFPSESGRIRGCIVPRRRPLLIEGMRLSLRLRVIDWLLRVHLGSLCFFAGKVRPPYERHWIERLDGELKPRRENCEIRGNEEPDWLRCGRRLRRRGCSAGTTRILFFESSHAQATQCMQDSGSVRSFRSIKLHGHPGSAPGSLWRTTRWRRFWYCPNKEREGSQLISRAASIVNHRRHHTAYPATSSLAKSTVQPGAHCGSTLRAPTPARAGKRPDFHGFR